MNSNLRRKVDAVSARVGQFFSGLNVTKREGLIAFGFFVLGIIAGS